MNLAIEPIQKSIEMIMRHNKERVQVDCPVCHKTDWEYLDDIIPNIDDNKHCICQNCGFVSRNPQLDDILSYYSGETRDQSISFLQTKMNKIERHRRLIFKFLEEESYEVG